MKDCGIHVLNAYGTTAGPFEQTSEFPYVQTHPANDDVSPLGHNKVDLISGIHAKNLSNGLWNRDLPLAGNGGGWHFSLPLVGILLCFLTKPSSRIGSWDLGVSSAACPFPPFSSSGEQRRRGWGSELRTSGWRPPGRVETEGSTQFHHAGIIVGTDEDLAGFGSLRRSDYAVGFHDLDQARGTRVAELETALEIRC